MTELVDLSAAAETHGPARLAAIGRLALGADAMILVDVSRTARPEVLGCSGLSASERPAVASALADTAGDGAVTIAGFTRGVAGEAPVIGGGVVRACALQRRRAPFQEPGLAGAIARHGAVAAALRRAPRSRDRDGGAQELIGRARDWASLDRVLSEQVGRSVGAQRTGVLMWREETGGLCPLPGTFGSDPAVALVAHAPGDWESAAARVFATATPYLTNHARADPGARAEQAAGLAVERLIAVPVTSRGRCVGVLQAIDKPGPFTLEDLQRVAAFAPVVAIAADVVAARERARRVERLEPLFTDTAVAIASGELLRVGLGARLDGLRLALGAAVLAFVAADGPTIVSSDDDGRARALQAGLLAQARAATGVRVLDSPPGRGEQPAWSAVHVPVQVDGVAVGTLCALTLAGGMSAPDVDALARMAQLIALGQRAEAYQRGLAEAARAAERRRIADELHDVVSQLLFAARLNLDLGAETASAAAAGAMQRAGELLARAELATREIMRRTAGGEPTGIEDRLAAVITEIEDGYGRPVGLEVVPDAAAAADRLPGGAGALLVRGAREALINAARHAGPCEVSVRLALTRRGRLSLTVTDSGVGVAARRGDGYGTRALRGALRRQGGTLRVASASSSGGTRVSIGLPA